MNSQQVTKQGQAEFGSISEGKQNPSTEHTLDVQDNSVEATAAREQEKDNKKESLLEKGAHAVHAAVDKIKGKDSPAAAPKGK